MNSSSSSFTPSDLVPCSYNRVCIYPGGVHELDESLCYGKMSRFPRKQNILTLMYLYEKSRACTFCIYWSWSAHTYQQSKQIWHLMLNMYEIHNETLETEGSCIWSKLFLLQYRICWCNLESCLVPDIPCLNPYAMACHVKGTHRARLC